MTSHIYKLLRDKTEGFLLVNIPFLHRRLHRHRLGLKYIIAGSTAAGVDLILLFLLTDMVGMWYFYSAIIAYICSFFTSFFLQKFWTFRDNDRSRIKKQLAIYIATAGVSLTLNSFFMFVFVSFFQIWYLTAQFITSALLAFGSFILNKTVTFKKLS
ncbi:MAG: GtrA family protein [bacterium]|nr:GtrA family protein [bacterium]